MDVTLLNEGGKYVAIDLKHIDRGGTCRMDESATIMRIGPGASAGTTRVRYMAPQLSSGGCPFLTEFEMPSDQFALARKSFEDKKEQAENKIADLKKQLGDKWDEAFGGGGERPVIYRLRARADACISGEDMR
jgi:hypothetical protein